MTSRKVPLWFGGRTYEAFLDETPSGNWTMWTPPSEPPAPDNTEPKKFFHLGSESVPLPVDYKTLRNGDIVYFPNLLSPEQPETIIWHSNLMISQITIGETSMMHKTKDAAVKHARAIISFNHTTVTESKQ